MVNSQQIFYLFGDPENQHGIVRDLYERGIKINGISFKDPNTIFYKQ